MGSSLLYARNGEGASATKSYTTFGPSSISSGLFSALRILSARFSTLRILSNDSWLCFSSPDICRPAKRSAAHNSACDRNNWSIKDTADFSLLVIPQYGHRGADAAGWVTARLSLRRFDGFLPIYPIGSDSTQRSHAPNAEDLLAGTRSIKASKLLRITWAKTLLIEN